MAIFGDFGEFPKFGADVERWYSLFGLLIRVTSGIGGIGGLSGPPSQPTYSPELTKSFYGFRAPMMEQMGTPYQGLQQQITSLKGTGHPIYG